MLELLSGFLVAAIDRDQAPEPALGILQLLLSLVDIRQGLEGDDILVVEP